MKLITPNSNIVRHPQPIKTSRTHDHSVMPPIPEKVVKRSSSVYSPLVKTSPPHS